jgi:alkylation response protein AidB-like acyl-CoA dehydrogenase
MDFSLNEIQVMLDDSIEKFIANDYDFDTRQQYVGGETGFSADVWRTFAELGWTAVPFAEEDGGFGGGPIDLMVVMQRFGKGLVVEPYLANVVLAGGVLKRTASAEQKERWLHPIIAGETQGALAYLEPQARYDISNVATTATADGDAWILNGSKGVVFNGGNADLIIVPARTSGTSTDVDGITLFALPADSEGLDRNAYPTVDGHQAAEIRLESVRCGRDQLIGEVDRGYSTLDRRLRRGCRHHADHDREDHRLFEGSHAVRRSHRQLPDIAASHGGHVHRMRAELFPADPGDDARGPGP